ncbi:hypothetical protein EMCRGX_G004160 [Ephydatia muelleri]
MVPRPQARFQSVIVVMAHVAVLHCLLEDSNLLGYERELLEQGADDVQQLQELGEEDFRQLCIAVGMAGKPLHMMRFSRALQRHYGHHGATPSPPSHHTDPFIRPSLTSTSTDSHKATQSTAGLPGQPSQAHLTTHLLSCKREPQEDTDSAPFWSQQRPGDQGEGCSPHATPPHRGPETPPTSSYGRNDASHDGGRLAWLRSGSTTPTSPSVDWTPLEELVDELTPVQSQLGPAPFPPSVWDRKRAELIRKSSAIYGGHLAKRRHLPLTAHEEDVNEASFQLCLRDPTLLVRRDELFLLARRAVKKRLGCANGGHGDPRGPQQCHGSGSPLLRAYPRGQKRPHPTTTTTTTTGNSCRGDQVDPSLKSCFREGGANVSSLGHTLMSIAGAPRGQVVPRPSDYTTLYTLPVWTDAAAAALRTATPTTLPLDPSMTIARRLQSLEDQGGHAHHLPMLGRVSREQEGRGKSIVPGGVQQRVPHIPSAGATRPVSSSCPLPLLFLLPLHQ